MVANAPGTFNSDALKHFDSLDALQNQLTQDAVLARAMTEKEA